MNSETKKCQNCNGEFVIEDEDFNFYKKVKVPPPTFCPKCRFQRRLCFVNLITLYHRKCDLCGEEKISMYAPEASCKVYCPQCWWSDNWDPFEYGREYDFSRPFFEQFKQHWLATPLLGLSIDLRTAATSPYNNHAGWLKNCYLLFDGDRNEDSAFGNMVLLCKSVLNCSLIRECELCYDSMNSYKNSRCIGLRSDVTGSLDCFFLKDSVNCQNCFASANLRNKKYYIFNKPFTKESYFKEINKWDLGSFNTYQEVQKLALDHWKSLPPRPHKEEFNSNCSGNYVFQSKNCKECYEVANAQDCKFIWDCSRIVRDCYDISIWGNNLQLAYEGCVVGENSSNLKFCQESGLTLSNAEYCKLSTGGSYHFGCVSVKKGDYVIFNKRYSKEEFEDLRAKIIKHMEEMPYVSEIRNSKSEIRKIVYKYGEFFPPELSPHAYNETLAQSFFPLSKGEIEKQGYAWREPEKREYQITLKAADLPDHIKDIRDDILKEVIGCAKCGRGYKIIQMELDFLRKMNLPLPRECPFCRINSKLDQWVKNLRLFDRTCSKCGVNFQTHYPKEEASYILCKKCWLAEFV